MEADGDRAGARGDRACCGNEHDYARLRRELAEARREVEALRGELGVRDGPDRDRRGRGPYRPPDPRVASEGRSVHHEVLRSQPVDPPAPTAAQARAWAGEAGLAVGDRGRFAAEVWQAYRDAHP